MRVTEKNFIKYIRKRREEGLMYVVETYGWVIRCVVQKHLFTLPDLQEECINDVLLAVWQHIDDYCPDIGSFKNWVAGISRFKAIDCKRKYVRHQNRCTLLDDGLEDDHASRQLLSLEVQDEIEELLSELSESERQIFEQYFLEEATVKEISEKMGLKEPAVYQRLSRGKRKLRKLRG